MKGYVRYTLPGLLLPTLAFAAPWSFEAPIDVTRAHGERVFHHLDAAGRKSIAATSGGVGVVWEDNRDGTPRCYFARKAAASAQFAPEVRISGADECYEPAVAALEDGRFVAVWEEGGRARARMIGVDGAGDAIALGERESAQASVGADGDVIYAAWKEKEDRYARVRVARLKADQLRLIIARRSWPDSQPPKDDQSYPTIAPARNGEVVVAWEDRRDGHTFIMQTFSTDGERFNPLRQVNETRNAAVPATTSRNRNLGRGPGAMRVALARLDEKNLIAVWLDKRDFLSGYDVYAAFSADGGRTFGKNQKVQDSFGDAIAQWHPAVAAGGGALAVVWDDDRDETPDLWMSWPDTGEWSSDTKPPGASGDGVQSDPGIALDPVGNLSLVWIEKDAANGATRLRYVFGKRLDAGRR
jgi:hypothetical protein